MEWSWTSLAEYVHRAQGSISNIEKKNDNTIKIFLSTKYFIIKILFKMSYGLYNMLLEYVIK